MPIAEGHSELVRRVLRVEPDRGVIFCVSGGELMRGHEFIGGADQMVLGFGLKLTGREARPMAKGRFVPMYI